MNTMKWLQKQRRLLITMGLAALLVLTAYVNYRMNTPTTDSLASNSIYTPKPTAGGASLNIRDTSANTSAMNNTDASNGQISGNSDAALAASTVARVSYFDDFKSDKTNTRKDAITQLDQIINDTRTDAQTLQQAQQQKLALTEAMEKELIIEGLIKSKGLGDSVVTYQKGTVNVVLSINAADLTAKQVAQVLDIVQRETGEKADNIKITPIAK